MSRAIVDKLPTPPDLRVALLAADQHGVVSVRQLRCCGLDRDAIALRVRRGRLHRVHRGVYAVGHIPHTMHTRFMAAVLACGDSAVGLAHHAGAALWEMLRWDGRDPEVTVMGDGGRALPGIRVHRARSLDARDIRRRDGIPVTSPARTLLDLAAVLPPTALRRAVRQAQADYHVNIRQLLELLARSNGHHGAGALRAAIADGPVPTRSEFEDIVLDLIDSTAIERPEINAHLHIDGRTIIPDLVWREHKLVIEADSARWHQDREHDANRQAILEAHGYRVLRITYDQATRRPQQTLTRIRRAVAG